MSTLAEKITALENRIAILDRDYDAAVANRDVETQRLLLKTIAECRASLREYEIQQSQSTAPSLDAHFPQQPQQVVSYSSAPAVDAPHIPLSTTHTESVEHSPRLQNFPSTSGSRLREVELKIYGVPIRYGLAPGGARAVICKFVNDVRFVQIDGFVQRIPDHDIKIILRGTTDHIDVVTTEIMSHFPDRDCQIETLRNISISSLKPNPSFIIFNSPSRDAMKSDQSPEKYDNHSSTSSHSLKESSLRS